LVRNRETLEPLAPFNGTATEMQALGKHFREHGLYTFVRWNTFFTKESKNRRPDPESPDSESPDYT